MKKINSIGYGPKILGAGGGLLALGGGLLGLWAWLGLPWLKTTGVCALAGGGLALLGLAALLAVELRQDKNIDRHYQSTLRRQVMTTKGGRAECQNCGAALADKSAKRCPICGTLFE